MTSHLCSRGSSWAWTGHVCLDSTYTSTRGVHWCVGTKANEMAAFCDERWERHLIITLNFIPALFECIIHMTVFSYFVLFCMILNYRYSLLKWKFHLVTSHIWSTGSSWAFVFCDSLDSTRTSMRVEHWCVATGSSDAGQALLVLGCWCLLRLINN